MKNIFIRILAVLGLTFGAVGVGAQPASAHPGDYPSVTIWTAGYPSGTITATSCTNCTAPPAADCPAMGNIAGGMRQAIAKAWGISVSRIGSVGYHATSGSWPNRSGYGTYKLDNGSDLGFYWSTWCNHWN